MSETAQKRYRRVFNAWTGGEYGYALELCRELVRTFPDYNIAWQLEGGLLYETARYAEAEQVLREAIQGMALEKLHYGYFDLGRLYKYQGHYDEAEKWYRKAVELKPEYSSSHVYLGVLLAAKGDVEGAETCYRKAMRCSEGRIEEAYLNLGLVLRSRERYEEALGCFKKALEIKPSYKEAKTGISDLEKTIRFLSGGSGISAEVTSRLVFDASNAGERAYALELGRELRRNDPDAAIWWLIEGGLLYEAGRYREAERVLHEVIQSASFKLLHQGLTKLGHLCRDQGRYDEAEKWYRKAIEGKSEDAGRHVVLGALLADKGDLSGAEVCHRKATQCTGGCVDEAYLNLGYVLRAQERYGEALECFNKALEITPDYKQAIVGKSDMEKVIALLSANQPQAKSKERIPSN
jgi:tetratricopeptide (TPR) repeat protein